LGTTRGSRRGLGRLDYFVAYTAKVNSFLPDALAPALAIIATAAEAMLVITLMLGIFRRPVAFTSAALFALFAGAMTISFGIKAPLNFSVFIDFAAASSGRLASVAKTQIK
jgi:putative oxidoreductase